MDCPKCGSNHFSKDGIVRNRQRYLCKKCSFRYTVMRRAGTADQATKRQALQLYLEGLGFRAIARLLNYSNVAILKWIREFGEKIEDVRNEEKTVEIIEVDEMHTYIRQKKTIAGYGLLLIEMKKNSSISHWVVGEPRREENFGAK